MAEPKNIAKKMPALDEKLPKLSPDAFLLVNVFAEDVTSVGVDTAKELAARGYGGVYVSLAKDYLSISALLEQAGADTSRFRFVDAVSRVYGIAPVESAEVVYVDGPLSIDSLLDGIAVSVRALKGEKRFVVLDSLTSILLYNTPEKTLSFSKSLKTLLKKERVAGVLVLAYQDAINQDLVLKLEKSGGEAVVAGEGAHTGR